MTRPEDVALLRALADLTDSTIDASVKLLSETFKTPREMGNWLRSLASRLEGEGRDAERLDWLDAHANPAHMGLSGTLPAKVCDVVTGRTYLGDTLREAIDAAMQSAPASSPQPTTTTETTPAGGGA